VDALADVERAAEVAPEDETVWGLQGEILQVLDREEEALASLDRAVELAPESPSVLAARARLRLGRQDATGALEDLDRALALKPDDVGLEWLRVLALARAGDVAEATARTSDLARRSESLLDAIRELAEMPPAVFESQARLASRLTGIPLRQIVRDRQLAELDRDTAVELLRAQSDVRERVAAGDVTGALARYDEAVTLIPTLAQLYAGRADIHIRLDDLDAADADLQRALELSPDDVDVLAARSRLRLSQGRPQDAVVDIDRAIELDRDDYLLRSVRFIAQNMLGDFLGAAEVADFLAQHAEEYVRQMRTRLASRLLAADPAGLDAGGEATVRRVFVEGGESAAVALVKAAAAEAQARVKRVEGDLEGALGSWSEALELAPDQPSAYSERAEIERLLGRHTEALADLERAIELGGETAPVRGTRGQVLRALGRREDALADLERALAEDPSLVWARRERAQLLVEVNRPEEALTEIDRVIELEPDNYIAYSFRLGLVQALGDFQGVVDTYAVLAEHAEEYVQQSRAQIPLSAIEAAPDAASAANLRAILEGDEAAAARLVRAEAAAARAQLQSSQGDLEGAVAGWNEALSLAPHLVIGYLTRADLQRLLDRPAEALADFDRAIELGAEGAPVRLARGVVLGAQGRTEEALTDLERALAEDPSLTAARVERADILLGDDRAEDALAEIERAIQAGDDTPVVRGTRGQALRALERRDEALADLDRALDADPSLNWARIERAGILLDERRSEEALHDLEILLEPNPDAAAPLIFRAIAKAQLRRYAEALADYERVAELVPGAGGFEADRAELLLLLGRPDEALRLSAGALAQVEEGEPEEIWLRYVHALARRALDEPDADEELRRLAREAESRAAEEHAEPHRLVQGALFRLAAGDEEEAERILQEAAREDDGLSPALARDVAADLETLSEILPEQAGAARRLAADLLSHA
jgi:tetratricopeptide (TPR) repeat protein